jgi:hypothetical protein
VLRDHREEIAQERALVVGQRGGARAVKRRGLGGRVTRADPGVPLAIGRSLLVGRWPPPSRAPDLGLLAPAALGLGLRAAALAVRAVLRRRGLIPLGLV